LRYIGQGKYVVGWPAADHDEPDEKLAKQKIKSGLYEPAERKKPKREVK